MGSVRFWINCLKESHALTETLGYLKNKTICEYGQKVNVFVPREENESRHFKRRNHSVTCFIGTGQDILEGILIAKYGRNLQEGSIKDKLILFLFFPSKILYTVSACLHLIFIMVPHWCTQIIKWLLLKEVISHELYQFRTCVSTTGLQQDEQVSYMKGNNTHWSSNSRWARKCLLMGLRYKLLIGKKWGTSSPVLGREEGGLI